MPCTTQSKPVDFLWISPAFFMNKLWVSSGKVSTFRPETTMGRALPADAANALPNSLDNYFPNAFARNAVTRAMTSSLAIHRQHCVALRVQPPRRLPEGAVAACERV